MSSASFAPLFTSVEKESATFEVVSEVLDAEAVVALTALVFDAEVAEVAEQPVRARAARRVMEVALLIILLFFTGFPLCLG